MNDINYTKIWADAWYVALACGYDGDHADAHARKAVAKAMAATAKQKKK